MNLMHFTSGRDIRRIAGKSVFIVISIMILLILSSISSVSAATNMIANPSAETLDPTNSSKPLDWFTTKTGTNTTTFSYPRNHAQNGKRSLRIEITAYVTGYAAWKPTGISISPNTHYSLTDYYKSSVPTQLVVEVTDSSGTVLYELTKTLPSSSNWAKADFSFTTSSTAHKLVIYHRISGVGTLQTDNYSLYSTSPSTPTPTATATSMPTTTPTSNPTGFNRPLLTLTFDDAIMTQFTNGWPIMKKYGLTGTFYINTGKLDGNWHMSPQNVIDLHSTGNHISSHTVTHPRLTSISSTDVDRELSQSQTYLQNLLKVSIKDFASPYGDYNSTVLSQIKQYYRSHRTTKSGYNTKSNLDVSQLYIQYVLNTTTASDIQGWIQQAKKDNSWLILTYHSITVNPDQWSTTPELFDSHLKTIKDSAIPVVTLGQAIDEIVPQR